MKGLGFLLLLALKIACDQGAVFDYSQSSESVGVFNGGDEGKFCIEAHGDINYSGIIRAPNHSGEVTYCNSQGPGILPLLVFYLACDRSAFTPTLPRSSTTA